MKKLRIATMVTGHFTTPPPEGVIYAPMDIAVDVSEGLVKRGHKVDFYGPLVICQGLALAENGILKIAEIAFNSLTYVATRHMRPAFLRPLSGSVGRHKIC